MGVGRAVREGTENEFLGHWSKEISNCDRQNDADD